MARAKTKKEILKSWIIDKLDSTNKKNFELNIGEVAGMERVMNYLLNGDSESDKDIKAAYKRLDERIYKTF